DRIQRGRRQTLSHERHLPPAPRAEWGIELARKTACCVQDGFAVPDEDQPHAVLSSSQSAGVGVSRASRYVSKLMRFQAADTFAGRYVSRMAASACTASVSSGG